MRTDQLQGRVGRTGVAFDLPRRLGPWVTAPALDRHRRGRGDLAQRHQGVRSQPGDHPVLRDILRRRGAGHEPVLVTLIGPLELMDPQHDLRVDRQLLRVRRVFLVPGLDVGLVLPHPLCTGSGEQLPSLVLQDRHGATTAAAPIASRRRYLRNSGKAAHCAHRCHIPWAIETVARLAHPSPSCAAAFVAGSYSQRPDSLIIARSPAPPGACCTCDPAGAPADTAASAPPWLQPAPLPRASAPQPSEDPLGVGRDLIELLHHRSPSSFATLWSYARHFRQLSSAGSLRLRHFVARIASPCHGPSAPYRQRIVHDFDHNHRQSDAIVKETVQNGHFSLFRDHKLRIWVGQDEGRELFLLRPLGCGWVLCGDEGVLWA